MCDPVSMAGLTNMAAALYSQNANAPTSGNIPYPRPTQAPTPQAPVQPPMAPNQQVVTPQGSSPYFTRANQPGPQPVATANQPGPQPVRRANQPGAQEVRTTNIPGYRPDPFSPPNPAPGVQQANRPAAQPVRRANQPGSLPVRRARRSAPGPVPRTRIQVPGQGR